MFSKQRDFFKEFPLLGKIFTSYIYFVGEKHVRLLLIFKSKTPCVIKIFPNNIAVFLLPIAKVQLAKSYRMGVALGGLQRALVSVM